MWPALGAVAGLIAGSFIATLVLRWPQGRTLAGRSACDACGVRLGVPDLVSLISYLAARGRCRRCGVVIDPIHPLTEILCAAVGGIALAVSPDPSGLTAALVGWLLVVLALLDIRHFWLPDVLTAALAAVAAMSAWFVTEPTTIDRLIGGAASFAVLWIVARTYRATRGRDGLGGGDPKLFGAIGLWLGWQVLPVVLLVAASLGLGYALWSIGRGSKVGATTRLPFGTFLAVAAFATWALSARGVLPL